MSSSPERERRDGAVQWYAINVSSWTPVLDSGHEGRVGGPDHTYVA